MSESTSGVEHGFEKTIRWWDGVAITLSLPAALFVGLGYSMGAIGAWAAVALWATIAVVAALHNWVYSEMGAMFSHKSGGIALYANEAWRKRFPSLGPLATYAYWFAWATAPAIWGLAVSQIVTEQFWPNATYVLDLGLIQLDLPQLIALGVALLSWALSMIELRFTMILITLAGVLLMIPVVIFGSGAFASPLWSSDTFTWRIPAGMEGLRTVLAWLFVMAWSAYAVEAAASFIPEYRDTVGDTRKALRVSALILLLVFTLTPLGLAGLLGEQGLAEHPNGFLQAGALALLGTGAAAITVVLIAGILVLSVMGTADAARALYQSSRDGLTVRQFGILNRNGVPARAVTVQLAINVALVLFVGNALAVIVAGNVGYVLAHLLAVSGFMILRKDQPDTPRPIRLPRRWIAIASALVVFDGLILIVGVTSASITGYGSFKEVGIAIGVLAISQVMFRLRRWQDRAHPLPAGSH
ncbi:APC family permease [Pseudomonas sp. R5(2019)]|uniref:APC family permease n=1 Tax=Pseudomonas sp. R5(2019) TaxID=2697566 RepID=UPI0014136764|nr:APC family permease [Pseudomonas sp. R5(2019)]NBA98376.1 amino acid permease [Pseudomonas sp. R5(2019)]